MPQKIVVPADRRLGFFPSITIACLLVACGYLGYLLLAEKSKAEPPPPEAVAAQNPDEGALRCQKGKWVTQVGSWREDSNAKSVFATLRRVQARAEKNGMKLRLYYTSPDKNSCSIVDRDVYFLWAGPYASGKAAIQICNKLGWTTARDSDYCYARTIDKNHKGKTLIRPNGAAW